MVDLVGLRRELHAHPELADAEHDTAARLIEVLEACGADEIVTGIAGTGIVATFDSGHPGPALLFRSELDALPIDETGDLPYVSTRSGVSHKCGHDGHMAIVIGLAHRLAERRPASGRVHLLFQPAEETGSGAAAMLADPAFDAYEPDVAYAIHNMPGHPLGTFIIKPGSITAAVRSIVIEFGGRTAHASEPHLGENPALAVADLLRGCDELSNPDQHDAGYGLITAVHVRVGSIAYGISAGDAEVHLTFRAHTDAGLAAVQERIVALAGQVAERDGLTVTHRSTEDFAANDNDTAATRVALEAARKLGFDVVSPPIGMPAGEDFGRFGQRFPTCMVLLGAGVDHEPLHNPDYDFPDELIDLGVALFEAIVHHPA